jgi:acetyl-CoA C-acetyltransferase
LSNGEPLGGNGVGGQAAIVGGYESPLRRAPRIHPFQIQADCVHRALDDAGLTLADVDGLCTAVGDVGEGANTEDLIELAEYLGITPTWFDSTDVGGCSFIVHVAHAATAISAGLAEVVVVSYAATPRWWPLEFPSLDSPVHPTGPGQFDVPYAATLVSLYALMASRHMHEFGTTPEQLAEIAVACRANAALNPDALYRDPITIDDVLASPMIASPLHRLDCCVLSDSGGAVVVTSRERAARCRSPYALISGFGQAVRHMQINQALPLTETPAVHSGRRAFEMAGLGHDDIDVAQIYDAFTITVLLALEDLGFCAKGDGGPFVAAGNIRPDGTLPINTDGGGLSSNHPGKRGIFLLIEALRQLRGESPGHQVSDARVALVHGIGGNLSATATMLLQRSGATS